MLSSVRQPPILAQKTILLIALVLVNSGCGGPSAFDPASFKESASFLSKSKPYVDFEAACKAKNPVQLQKATDEFATSIAALKGQEVRWTLIVSKIEEDGCLFKVSNHDVLVAGYLQSKDAPDWKTTVAGLAVGQSVNITAKIKIINPYASYQGMMETWLKDLGVEVNEQSVKRFAAEFGPIFSGNGTIDEKRETPFIFVALSDAKPN